MTEIITRAEAKARSDRLSEQRRSRPRSEEMPSK